MARRTRQEAVATREALLDAAEREFRGKGVAHTTLADVAEAAGLTRGAIYWHFRDKAELFEAMCERAAMPMEAMLGCGGGKRCADPLGTLRDMAVLGIDEASARRAHAGRVRRDVPQMRVHGRFGACRAAAANGRRRLPAPGDRAPRKGRRAPSAACRHRRQARRRIAEGVHGGRDARMGAEPLRLRSRAHGTGDDRHGARGSRDESAASCSPAQGCAAIGAPGGSSLGCYAATRTRAALTLAFASRSAVRKPSSITGW